MERASELVGGLVQHVNKQTSRRTKMITCHFKQNKPDGAQTLTLLPPPTDNIGQHWTNRAGSPPAGQITWLTTASSCALSAS